MRLLKNPLFYFNVVLVVVIGLLITSVNANQTNFPALAKKAIAAVQQIIGQGEINKLAAFSGTNTIGNSQIFDNGTNVGVGTIFPLGKLHVVTDVAGDYVGVSNSLVSTYAYIAQSGDLVGTGTGYANDFCTWGGKCLSTTGNGKSGDNLGNHIATTNLDMDGKSIIGGKGSWTPAMRGAYGNAISWSWTGSKLQYKIDSTVYDIPEYITVSNIRYSENRGDLPLVNCPSNYTEVYRDSRSGIYWGSTPNRYGSIVTLTCKK